MAGGSVLSRNTQKTSPENVNISTDQSLIDFDRICHFIQNSYWGSGRSQQSILTSFQNSICFSALDNNQQIGFARVVTDYAYHAYIFDLFVFEDFRGQGIAKQIMQAILDHNDLKDISGFMLTTHDAHRIYEPFGFKIITDPDRYMSRA